MPSVQRRQLKNNSFVWGREWGGFGNGLLPVAFMHIQLVCDSGSLSTAVGFTVNNYKSDNLLGRL